MAPNFRTFKSPGITGGQTGNYGAAHGMSDLGAIFGTLNARSPDFGSMSQNLIKNNATLNATQSLADDQKDAFQIQLDAENKYFSLKGFLNPKVIDWNKTQRQEAVISELRTLFKDEFPEQFEYIDKVWINDQFVSSRKFEYTSPKQNNGVEILSAPQWNRHLYFSGTETAKHYPGYMEGALESALHCFKQLSFN